jgi:large subunit ribosomal protein L24e
MKRNPRKVKWTKSFRRAAGKEMVVDSTLAFAAKRNVPIRYNRDLVQSTLRAMKRISEIKDRRERRHYKERMRGNKERQRQADRKLVAEHSHLLPRVREEDLADTEDVDMEREKIAIKAAPVFGKENLRKKSKLLRTGQEMEVDDE